MKNSLKEKILAATLSEREVSLVCSRIDVRRKLYREYKDHNFDEPELTSGLLEKSDVQKLFGMFLENLQSYNGLLRHKCLNTMLKLSDGILGFPVCNDTEFKNLNELVNSLSIELVPGGLPLCFDIPLNQQDAEVLNIVLLYYPGPAGNAYLYGLVSSGYLPSKILVLPNRNLATLRRMLSLRRLLRTGLNQFKRTPNLRPLSDKKISCSPIALRKIEIERKDYFQYLVSEVNVTDVIKAAGPINSAALSEQIYGFAEKAVIFSGGGLLSKDFLDGVGKKIVHMHPGLLPDIRGADGLFWSILLKGKPGVTAFFMKPGIDVGDVLSQSEFELPPRREVTDGNIQSIYRGLLETFDPWCRAKALVRLLDESENKNLDLENMPVVAQKIGEGMSFHFMHPKMRAKVIKSMMAK